MKYIFLFFCLSNIVFFTQAQVDLNLGLRAYYPFTGNANDVAGNNNNPIYNNATLTADRFGNANNAYHFNGIDNYMRIPNAPTLNTTNMLSVCVFVKPMGYYGGPCHGNSIVMKADEDYLPGTYFLRYDDNFYTNGGNCSIGIPDPLHENFFALGAIAPTPGYTPYIQTDEWHSVICTYDGTTALLYIDCELKVTAPQNGMTFTNPYDLFFGTLNNASFPYWLNGDLDEVRIYDRAINFDEVKAISGCIPVDSVIINQYTPVLALNPCNNSLTVEDGSEFNVGDTVLMIQMKGAVIDSTESSSFGSILNYHNAGNYEFNYISQKNGNILSLKSVITRQYDIPDGKVQLIRVPYYANPVFSSTLTCLPWDGSKGGILAFNARDTVTLNANLDVSGRGFFGGTGFNSNDPQLTCFQNDYNYDVAAQVIAGLKGESIASLAQNFVRGKGAPASGGGGGLGHNSGGGGGANAGKGGFGGYQLNNCGNFPFDNRGIGGHALTYSSAINKIFMGGGGGAGNADNPNNINPSGGNGGGIIIVNAGFLKSNGNKIIANGADGLACTVPPYLDCHDGMAGGGGGGSVLLNINQIIDNSIVEQKGGNGIDMVASVAIGGKVGPGGGGGGGALFIKNSSLSALITSISTGGTNGVLTQDGNNPYGATPGTNGLNLFNLLVPFDEELFTPNIDSIRITDSALSCAQFQFHGFGYTNSLPVVTWNWNFGDGGQSQIQNPTHSYFGNGPYTVHLVGTDVSGCKDSMTIIVTPAVVSVAAEGDTSFCSNTTVTHILHAVTNGAGYLWTPANLLDNNSLQNPTATVSSTTTFYLTVPNISGCIAIDSVKITVNPVPVISTINDLIICKSDSLVLTTNGTAAIYQWAPAASVNNPFISSPYFIGTSSQQLVVTGSYPGGACIAKDTVNIFLKPLPVIQTIPDTTLCGAATITLTTTGGQTYSWSPATYLSNTTIANPVFTGTATQTYYVTGTGTNSCKAKDTIKITLNAQPVVNTINNIEICNGDSLQLFTNTTAQVNHWSPALTVSNPNIANPYFTGTVSQMLYITGTNSTGCFAKDSVYVTVKPTPFIQTIPDTSFCGAQNISLTTTGGQSYTWSPTTNLSNPSIANPIFTGTNNQAYTFIVVGSGANTCEAKDTVTITVNAKPIVNTINNISICRGDSLQLLTNSTAQSNHWTPPLSVNNPSSINPYFTDTVTQTLTVTGTNSTGCSASDIVTVVVKPLPVVKTIEDTAYCGAGTITLTTTGGNLYSWFPAAGLNNSGIANPVFTNTVPNVYTYYVTGTGPNFCKANDTVQITSNAIPFVSTLPDTGFCRGDILLLTSNINAQHISWSPPASVSNPNIANPYFTDTISLPLTVTGTTNSGCTASDVINVTVKPEPLVRSISDVNTCSTNTVTLFTTGAQTYSWAPATNLNSASSANPIFTGTGSYTYYVTGTAANGCKAKDTVNIHISTKPVFVAPANATICYKDSTQLNGNNGPSFQYAWSPHTGLNNSNILDPVSSPALTTAYHLVITDQVCNYDSNFIVVVTVNPLPKVSASKSNDLDCLKSDSRLNASGALQYTWRPETALDFAHIYNPLATPDITTAYVVTGTDMKGCSNSDSIIIVVKGGKYFNYNIPNSFTPNSDGLNDCFGVQWWGKTKNFHLVIYNRWGAKVFETYEVSDCWNGIYKGQPADVDNYVYYLTGETLCGKVNKKGNVLLIR